MAHRRLSNNMGIMIRIHSLVIFAYIVLSTVLASADQVEGLYAAAYGSPTSRAILFLHGGPGYNSYSFEYTNAKVLAERGYYVVVFDQRGCGRSARAPEDEFTFQNAVKDVRTVVEHYHLKNPLIIGHSYGGTLAIKYAQAYPHDYSRLVLADAPMDQQGMVANILDRCKKFYSDKSDPSGVGYITQIQNFIFGSGKYTIDPEYGGYVFAHATQCRLYQPENPSPQRTVLNQQLVQGPNAKLLTDSEPVPFAGLIMNEDWLKKNLMPDLVALKNKVTIIIGSDDGLFSKKQIDELQFNFGEKLLIVPNASHNIFIDQQGVFLNFIERAAR
jgi:proline iminopeptidase